MKQELFAWPEVEGDRNIHGPLSFAIPSAVLMPVMLWTGLTRRRRAHLALAWLFGLLWLGTFVTGVFTLPHTD